MQGQMQDAEETNHSTPTSSDDDQSLAKQVWLDQGKRWRMCCVSARHPRTTDDKVSVRDYDCPFDGTLVASYP